LSDMYHTGKSLQDRPETMTMKSFKSSGWHIINQHLFKP
jgi:hypothetical protein